MYKMSYEKAMGGSSLQELSEMADSVMEVISSSIATVATPHATEVGELKAKVASLKRQLLELQDTGRCRSNSSSNRRARS